METTIKLDSKGKETRRLLAIKLLEKGLKSIDVASLLDVTLGAVSQWQKAFKEKGIETLYRFEGAKRPRKITPEQEKQIQAMLLEGAEKFGYEGNLWTASRVQELIEKHFSITYCIRQVHKLLKKWGWTPQKPATRARQRDEERIHGWWEKRWPEIKKALEEGRTIVFADESGFYLFPFIAKTYAPKSQTPILRSRLSREHISAASGITMEGKIYAQVQNRSFKGGDAAEFLRHLMRHIKGKLLVIWDGCSIHRAKRLKSFFLMIMVRGFIWNGCPLIVLIPIRTKEYGNI